ncbi:S1C family serine protease [Candidatus Uabimicrobium amorphum]|uniref:2-alkenal reductase n=1 Tax=Uabimicrobium amorphum TaxID=2596890 RepID=A0A5S9IIJ4_UABAM|nr:trypsin-like peptidase domain-containing protein [Candidatus Uabimicrobium amorphum]BBM82031.1 2-alkenal reductase [Candidatus Uabimicrobium amorphum]
MRIVFIILFIPVVFGQNQEEFFALQKAFSKAAKKIAPYLVRIEVKRTKDIPLPPPSFFLQDFESLPSIHRRHWKKFLQETIEVSKRPKGKVSGIMISARGEIVTSYYNIAGKTKSIRVFVDGAEYPAKLIAYSKLDDIALLRINKRLPQIIMRKHDPQLGDWAVVIAKSKSSKYHTINSGIVSGTKRYRGYSSQLDAKVDHANSGGAVVDIYGNFVGVVNRVSHYAKSGQSSGVGFFTTTKRLLHILPTLRQRKNIPIPTRPFLGIRVSRMQISKKSGTFSVVVDSVFPDTPAYKAGLRSGDIIVAVDNKRMRKRSDFSSWVEEAGVKRPVMFRVIRGNTVRNFQVEMKKRPLFF